MGAGGKAKWWRALSSDPWPCGKRLRDHFPWISSHDPLLGDFVARTTVAKTDWRSLGKNSLCYVCTPNLLWYLLLDPALGVSRWKLRNSRKGKRLLPPRGSLQSYMDLHKVHGLSECACTPQIQAPLPSVVSLFRPQYQKEFQSLRFSSATFSWE